MKTATAIIKSFSALLPFAEGGVVRDGARLETTCSAGAAAADELETGELSATFETGLPHFSQNLIPENKGEPHLMQNCFGLAESVEATRLAPHFVQKVFASASKVPQFLQVATISSNPQFAEKNKSQH